MGIFLVAMIRGGLIFPDAQRHKLSDGSQSHEFNIPIYYFLIAGEDDFLLFR